MDIQTQLSQLTKAAEQAYQKALDAGGSFEQANAAMQKAIGELAAKLGLPEGFNEAVASLPSISSSGTLAMQFNALEAQLKAILEQQNNTDKDGEQTNTESIAQANSALLDPIVLAETSTLADNNSEDSLTLDATTAQNTTELPNFDASPIVVSKARSVAIDEDDDVKSTDNVSETLTPNSSSSFLSYEDDQGDGVIVDLGLGIAADGFGGIDNVEGFLNVKGSNSDDYIKGDDNANIIYGLDGDDTILGEGGDDLIHLNDDVGLSIDGGAGSDTISFATAGSEGAALNLGSQVSNVEAIVGSNYADFFTFTGSSDISETISGGAGNDIISSAGSEDVADGGAGDDTLTYAFDSAGVNVDLNNSNFSNFEALQGSSLADTITAKSGIEINALAGDDYITGVDASTDDIDGSAGTDTLSYANASSGQTLDLGSSSDSIDNIEAVVGSAYGDTLTGASTASNISGGAGNDVITGSAVTGSDTLDGGAGHDIIYSQSDSAIVVGGSGNDTLTFANDNDGVVYDAGANATGVETITGSSSDDEFIITGSSTSYIDAGAGNDTLSFENSTTGVTFDVNSSTYANFENFEGSAHADYITGSGGNDVIDGGDGDDTIALSGSKVFTSIDLSDSKYQNIEAVQGSSLGENITGSSAAETLKGGEGSDNLNSGGGADSLYGEGGNDQIYFTGSETLIDGGTGNDTLTFNDSDSSGLTLTAGAHSNIEVISGGGGNDIINSSDDVYSIDGGAGDDHIYASGSETFISGGNGNDTVELTEAGTLYIGGEGVENYIGSDGNDTFSIDYTSGETIDGGAGTDTIQLNNSGTIDLSSSHISNIEAVTGSSSNDSITGSSNSDYLDGAGGNDTIYGGEGDDIIIGGSGFDTISGGYGNDHITVGTSDSVDGGVGSDTLVLSESMSLSAAQHSSIENIQGSSGDDTIYADSNAAETITGGGGNDFIDGSNGADDIDGGTGDDTIYAYGSETFIAGGVGNDVLSIQGADSTYDQSGGESDNISGFETLDASDLGYGANVTLKGGAGIETITGGEGNDQIVGGGGADSIDAGDGDDYIYGSTSAEIISGGSGNDTIDAVGGADTISAGSDDDFVFADTNTSASIDGGTGTDTISFVRETDGFNTANLNFSNFEVITGGSGNDTITDPTADTIDGGAGTDVVDFSTSGSGISETLSGYTNVEDFIGSAFDDTISGSGSLDSLDAGAGDDHINNISGSVIISGGSGNDNIEIEDANVTVHGGAGSADILTIGASGASTVDLTSSQYTGIERVDGGSTADSITGTSGNETLYGYAGNDTIDGNGGSDSIDAGTGDDSIVGSSTTFQSIDGGDGTDTLSFDPTLTGMNLTLGASNLSNIEVLNTTDNADTITGSSNADSVNAGAGDDSLTLTGGNDTFRGGDGADDFHFANTNTTNTTLNFLMDAGMSDGDVDEFIINLNVGYGGETTATTIVAINPTVSNVGLITIENFETNMDMLRFVNTTGGGPAVTISDLDSFSTVTDLGDDAQISIGNLDIVIKGGGTSLDADPTLVELDDTSLGYLISITTTA